MMVQVLKTEFKRKFNINYRFDIKHRFDIKFNSYDNSILS